MHAMHPSERWRRRHEIGFEGHEDFFLRGAANWLHRDRPIILTEVNNWYYEKRNTTSSAVFAPVLPKGYQVCLLRQQGARLKVEPCELAALALLPRVETCLMYPAERRHDVQQAID